MRKTAILCALALIVSATEAAGLPLKPWVGVSGSVNTYEMGDLNSRISDISLTDIDEIGNGYAFGVHAGLGVSPMFTVSAGYEFLTAGTDMSGLAQAFDFNLPAHAYRGGLEVRAPTPGPFKVGAGASVGRVSVAGDVLATGLGAELENLVGEVSGSGPLYEGYAMVDFWFSPMMALSPAVGYRHAKISEVKVNDQTFTNPIDGSEYSLDYSGYYMRLSLKLSLP